MASLRVCAEVGCPILLPKAGRCPQHARERDRARGTSTERGYDYDHRRMRREWQRRIDRGDLVECWRCGRRLAGRDWHLGHDDHDRSITRGPECVPCNLSAAGRASHG